MKKVGLLIGNFDGVHLGHQALLKCALETSSELEILSFAPHPLKVLQPERAPQRILDFEQQSEVLKAWKVRQIHRIEFTAEYSRKSARRFFEEEILPKKIHTLVVGQDFRFGQNRQAGVSELSLWCQEFSIHFEAVAPQKLNERVMSSSWIRESLRQADLETAAKILGRRPAIAGTVVEGRKLARTLQFPTANLRLSSEMEQKLALSLGVYYGKERRLGPCVLNVGTAPTISDNKDLKVEVHLLDFSGSLYGQRLEVDLYGHLRSEMKFSGLDELKKQIQADVHQAKLRLGVL